MKDLDVEKKQFTVVFDSEEAFHAEAELSEAAVPSLNDTKALIGDLLSDRVVEDFLKDESPSSPRAESSVSNLLYSIFSVDFPAILGPNYCPDRTTSTCTCE